MWSERVSEWRASGESSTAFCKGKSFTAGGLRYWAHRLKGAESRGKPSKPEIRLARVLRTPAPARAEVRVRSLQRRETASAPAAGPALVIKVSGARVSVRPGFDRATLAAVLDVLAAKGGR